MDHRKVKPTPYKPMSQRDADIARALGSKYQFIKYLGRGTHSTVFAVLNKPLRRVEALKVLSDELTRQDDFRNRFKVEAKIIASLDHPNIVTLYEYNRVKNYYFFSMYHVDGPLLTKFIRSSTPMPVHSVCTNIATVCNAMDYAHKRGVIHRDLKASNIMLDKSGKPYIADFGIAKWEKSLTRTQSGLIMGSPHYVSPEQAAGREVDVRSDIYSLGVTLYALLTQEYPFRGDTPHLTIAQRLSNPPIPPETFNPDLPHRLIDIINKALQEDRRDRYQSATELAEDLTHFVASEKHTEEGQEAVKLKKQSSIAPTPVKKWAIAAIALAAMVIAVPTLLSLNSNDDGSGVQNKPSSPSEDRIPVDQIKDPPARNRPSAAPLQEGKDHQALKLLISAIEQDYADGKFAACIEVASAAKMIFNKMPDHQQVRYAQLKEKAESYQLKATRAIQRDRRLKQEASTDTRINSESSRLPGHNAENSRPAKNTEHRASNVKYEEQALEKRNQELNKLLGKIDREFKNGDVEDCLQTAISAIKKIESFENDQQAYFSGTKAKFVTYRRKAAREKRIRDQKRSITAKIQKKVAQGDFEDAITMIDTMLRQTGLVPEVEDVLRTHRRNIEMLLKETP